MIVYRIASNLYIKDLSGEGAKRTGGRWNSKGVAVLYTGSSLALSAWEYFVHLPEDLNLKNNTFSSVSIDIPNHSIKEWDYSALPSNWRKIRKPLHDVVNRWLLEKEFLAIKVPSAIVEGEFNYILNPNFPDYLSLVKIIAISPFSFDRRAFNKKLIR